MSAPELRPYQLAQLDAICTARETGTNRVLVKSPTGTGKTVTFAAMLRYPRMQAWLASLPPKAGAKMLVIAHREELLDQAAEKIRAANPGLMISIEQGDRHANSYSDVVIASIQTLAARKFHRLQRLLQRHAPRIVIVDEAHHAAAATYRTALALLGFLPTTVSADGDAEAATHDDVKVMEAALRGWDAQAPKDRLLVGVTATPNRSDAIGLGCVFQTIAYSYGLKDAIDDGYLAPIKPWVIETAESLDDVRVNRGDFNQKDLAETVNTPRRNRLALDGWKLYAGDRSTLAFTVDVQHARDAAALFRADGVQAAYVSGDTDRDERRGILADYSAGRLQIVFNCMVLTEGTDLPRTSCILHMKPTKSATLYEQMTGRGLRLFDGKDNCIVLDLVDIARKHSLQAAPVLYGLPPGVKTKGDELGKLADDFEQFREANPNFDVEAALRDGRLSMKELLDRASSFDVWRIPPLGVFGEGLAMNWIRSGDQDFRLQYPWQDGTETLHVRQDLLGHFDLVATFRPREQAGVRQRTIAAQIADARSALAVAEAFVQENRREVTRLKDRDAKWRKAPASEKQIAALQRQRIPHNPKTITKGQASDLLDLAAARRGR